MLLCDLTGELQVTNAYQAGILVREKAYVINLECVKMIVTQDQARHNLPHVCTHPQNLIRHASLCFAQKLRLPLCS